MLKIKQNTKIHFVESVKFKFLHYAQKETWDCT